MSDYRVGWKELEEALLVTTDAMGADGEALEALEAGEYPPAKEVDITDTIAMLEEEGIDPDELRGYAKNEVRVIFESEIFQRIFEIDPEGLAAAIWLMGFTRAWFVLKKLNNPLEKAFSDE